MHDNLMNQDSITADNYSNPQSTQQTSISIKVKPGFSCFFESYVSANQLQYYECYQKLIQSALQIERIRFPIQRILKDENLHFAQKINRIVSRSSPHQKICVMNGSSMNVYAYGKQKQEQLHNLQKQIQLYRRQNQQTLLVKKNQFKLMRQQEQAILQKLQQQKKRKQEVLYNTQKWIKENIKTPNQNQNSLPAYSRDISQSEPKKDIFHEVKDWFQSQSLAVSNSIADLSQSIKKSIPW